MPNNNDNTNTDTDSTDSADSNPTRYTAIVHERDIVSLDLEADFTETAVPHQPTLHRIIRDCCGLESSDLTTKKGNRVARRCSQ
jgi:hypothetical protein